MDIFQLKCFLNVVEQKSFTKAAYEVLISQSALSKKISKLEDELGIQLFDRSKRFALLTPVGQEFEPHARKILADYNTMMDAVKRYSTNRLLRVGSIKHMGRVGLTTPIATFLGQYPDGRVNIDIKVGSTLQLMDQLVEGKLDMAFIALIASTISGSSNIDTYQLEQYHRYTLVRDEYHVIVSSQHRLARQEIVSWRDLVSERLLILGKGYSSNAAIRDTFLRQGLQPNIAFECDQVDALLGMVEENFGVSVLSKRIATTRYAVTSVPMEHPITRDTVLVIPKVVESRHRLAGEFARHVINYYNNTSARP